MLMIGQRVTQGAIETVLAAQLRYHAMLWLYEGRSHCERYPKGYRAVTDKADKSRHGQLSGRMSCEPLSRSARTLSALATHLAAHVQHPAFPRYIYRNTTSWTARPEKRRSSNLFSLFSFTCVWPGVLCFSSTLSGVHGPSHTRCHLLSQVPNIFPSRPLSHSFVRQPH